MQFVFHAVGLAALFPSPGRWSSSSSQPPSLGEVSAHMRVRKSVPYNASTADAARASKPIPPESDRWYASLSPSRDLQRGWRPY